MAEARVARPQKCTDANAGLSTIGQQRMVARTPVVARIRPRQRSLLSAKDALDRRVDIEVYVLSAQLLHTREPVPHHQRFEIPKRSCVESREVAIHRVDARYDAACESDEERIGRERFESEDARLPCDVGVQQEAELRLHRVDDQRTALQPEEVATELCVYAFVSAENTEARQACDARQRRVRTTWMDSRRVRSADAIVTAIAVSTLAAANVPAHLMDARRARSFCSHKRFDERGEP
jgi:hypothetical protein